MAYSGSIIGGEIHSVVASTGKFQHCLEFLVLDVHLDHVIFLVAGICVFAVWLIFPLDILTVKYP